MNKVARKPKTAKSTIKAIDSVTEKDNKPKIEFTNVRGGSLEELLSKLPKGSEEAQSKTWDNYADGEHTVQVVDTDEFYGALSYTLPDGTQRYKTFVNVANGLGKIYVPSAGLEGFKRGQWLLVQLSTIEVTPKADQDFEPYSKRVAVVIEELESEEA